MKYSIDQTSRTPGYLQLYEQLKSDIVSGSYEYGQRLPSKRMIAEETGTSVITAEHAFALLCDEGYAHSRERSGYFAAFRRSDFISVGGADTRPGQIEQRESREPTVAPSNIAFSFSGISKKIRKILLDYGDRILVKSPNRGCMELRCAISTYLSRSVGISAEPEQIVIGSGAEYLYSMAAQIFGAGTSIAIEDPSYEKIRKVYTANGINCRPLKMGGDGILTDALEACDAFVLHVTPFNSYPTGIYASASKKAEYVYWARERGGFIVEDNYDSELTVSRKFEETVFSVSNDENVIYLNTFSRTVAPSLRVGYMILPKRLLAIFEEKAGFYSCTVPVLEQYLLAELIRSGDFERHINHVRRLRRNGNGFADKR